MQVRSFFCGIHVLCMNARTRITQLQVTSCDMAFTARLALPVVEHYEGSILLVLLVEDPT
jgi:hypothetical protein